MPSTKKLPKKAKPKKTALATGKNGNDWKSKLTEQVSKQLIQGHSTTDIINYLTKEDEGRPFPKIDPYQARLCVAAAWSILNEEAQERKKNVTNLAESAVMMLYQKMVEVGDFAGALSAMKEFNRMHKGQVEPTQPNILQQEAKFLLDNDV